MADNQKKAPEAKTDKNVFLEWWAQLADSLNKKVPDAGFCRECQQAKVEIAPDVVTPVSMRDGNVTISGSYPQVMAICTNCGHTRYFSMVILGLPLPPNPGDIPLPSAIDLLKKPPSPAKQPPPKK
ncbi:MAG: hypothetical protein AB7V46_18870 [Thermomicrobiales bacterium]